MSLKFKEKSTNLLLCCTTIQCIPCFKQKGCSCEHNCGGHSPDCGQGCPIKWVPID